MSVPLFAQSKQVVFKEIQDGLPLDPFSMSEAYPLKDTETDGYSAIWRNKKSQNALINAPHPSVSTIKDIIEISRENFTSYNCIGERTREADGSRGPYRWETYAQIDAVLKLFAAGIFFVLGNNAFISETGAYQKVTDHYKSVLSGEMSFILTVYAANRREWLVTDLACAQYAITNTALYDTLGKESAKHILALTESPVVVCSKDKVAQLVELKQTDSALSNLVAIVLMDGLDASDDHLVRNAKAAKITVYDFEQVVKLGTMNPVTATPPNPETAYTISFTSGTTSMPKGVVLTHANAVSALTFCLANSKIAERPKYYCFLPFAHVYQRLVLLLALFLGSAIGMPLSALPATLIDDIKTLEPHNLVLVPRVLTRLEAALKKATVDNAQKPVMQMLFTKAVRTKTDLMLAADGAEGRHFFHDRFLSLLRKKLGLANLDSIFTGSAPIAPETVKFMRSVLNTGIAQGYGLTESFAGVSNSLFYEANPGSCGPISITTEMRLRELPQMNYTSRDEGGPRGEVMLRGPQIFKEYYKNAEETSKSKDADGWFSTGDVAQIDAATGRIYIIDRVKNFFKLAQGEYVTPEKIENTYLSAFPVLSQIFVHGDSLKTFLVAIAGVEPDSIRPWIKSNFGQKLSTDEEIIQFMNTPDANSRFLKSMNAAVGDSVQGFERVHNLRIGIQPMTIEDGVITPTMKVKRVFAAKFFNRELKEMYDEGSLLKPKGLVL